MHYSYEYSKSFVAPKVRRADLIVSKIRFRKKFIAKLFLCNWEVYKIACYQSTKQNIITVLVCITK